MEIAGSIMIFARKIFFRRMSLTHCQKFRYQLLLPDQVLPIGLQYFLQRFRFPVFYFFKFKDWFTSNKMVPIPYFLVAIWYTGKNILSLNPDGNLSTPNWNK